MMLELLFGFVFVAFAVATKLHVSLLNVKLVGFFVQERYFGGFFFVLFFFPWEMLLAASLLLDLVLT